jgi:hypothetical protein
MGEAVEGGFVYKMKLDRRSQEKHNVRHKLNDGCKITGIVCMPVSSEMDSPEYDVVEGGINYDFVTICLTPGDGRVWGCEIHICFKNE